MHNFVPVFSGNYSEEYSNSLTSRWEICMSVLNKKRERAFDVPGVTYGKKKKLLCNNLLYLNIILDLVNLSVRTQIKCGFLQVGEIKISRASIKAVGLEKTQQIAGP